jgi:Animal haem peroxidase
MNHIQCLSPARAQRPIDAPIGPTMYGRLFAELPSFSVEQELLFALGRVGGLCDCGDEEDNPASLASVAAGWPIFGQFIAHDITADRSAPQAHVDPSQLRNARSPRLNLEGLYGDGPVGHPFLFRRDDPAKLLTAPGGRDLLRNTEGTAIIGDPRNDSHVLVSQMHLAFVHAHNAFVDQARAGGQPEARVFEAAARELLWHYQTVVLREFLPSLIGAGITDLIMRGDRRYYRPHDQPFIPLEFADAAYRYGHSQIRHAYQLNAAGDAVPIFPDLLGFRPVAAQHHIEWSGLFDAPGAPPAARSKKIDGRLVGALIALPVALTGVSEVKELQSLAVRDLARGQGVGLPSGEAVARRMGERPLTAEEVGTTSAGWTSETPLWYYILREADVRNAGDRLGPVGARIVGEVLIGLLDLDPSSVRHAPSSWTPSATLIDLLTGPPWPES